MGFRVSSTKLSWRQLCTVVGLSAACIGVGSIAQAQISFVSTFRSSENAQTGNGNSLSTLGTFFTAELTSVSPGDFNTATLTYPGPGSPVGLSQILPNFFRFQTGFLADQAALDAAYPMGTYQFDADGPAGPATTSFDYNADFYPTTVPYLDGTNYSDLQGMNAANPFSFAFSPFGTGVGADASLLFFTIFDNTTSTFAFNAAFLPASTTGLVMPANTLAAGHSYTYELIFSNREQFAAPGSVFPAQVGYDLRTRGDFTTLAVPEPSTLCLAGAMAFVAGGTFLRKRARRVS